jgi:predicted ABC-type ATPase
VNVDLIASGLSPFDPKRAALKAGRIVVEQIHSLAKRVLDFGFESTLSGKTYVLKYKGNQWKGQEKNLLCLHIKLKKHFVRLWLKRSPNITEMGFPLPSGAMAKWFGSLLIR